MKTLHLILIAGLTVPAFSWRAYATCQQGCLTDNNTVLGDDALLNNSSSGNTAVGFNALFANTVGDSNTAIGELAMASNIGGFNNTAIGGSALLSNTSGFANTAVGHLTLFNNTTGDFNTSIGWQVLFNNTAGNDNTGVGVLALSANKTGISNTATGSHALPNNTTGNKNTAIGGYVLFGNTTGQSNTGVGYNALYNNEVSPDGKVGNGNTGVGVRALFNNKWGVGNIALGRDAGANLTTGSDNIEIGNSGVAGEAATIRIGTEGTQSSTHIAGISGATIPSGVAVIIDTTGHLGTVTSSARYKEDIKSMDKASEVLLGLKPVTFRYKKELDAKAIPQFGLVAEDVAKVDPDLVARDDEGKPYSVRYEAVNAMLLNEFLKEHKKVETESSEISELKATVAELKAALKDQAAQVRQVSAQLATMQKSSLLVTNKLHPL